MVTNPLTSPEAFALLREADLSGVLLTEELSCESGKIPTMVRKYQISSGEIVVLKTPNGTLRGIEYQGERYDYG